MQAVQRAPKRRTAGAGTGRRATIGCRLVGSWRPWRWPRSRRRRRMLPSNRTGRTTPAAFATSCPPARTAPTTPSQLAQFETTGTLPPHWTDQQPLYDNLLYASPTLTHEQIADYFKDATFGVKAGDVESTDARAPTSRSCATRATASRTSTAPRAPASMFGAGYAGAEDRLFLMDVLRHTGRAPALLVRRRLAGQPRDGPRAVAVRALHGGRPAEADRQRRRVYGAGGRSRSSTTSTTSSPGINAYIDDALIDPSMMPAEYAALGKVPAALEADRRDRRGVADRRHLRQGRRQRAALGADAAGVREALRQAAGREGVARLPREERPRGADHGLKKRFPYETARRSRSAAWRCPTRARSPHRRSRRRSRRRQRSAARPLGGAPERGSSARADARRSTSAATRRTGSWSRARHSATGHPIGVLGPQVGYYDPEILMEEDLHGPGIDARGAAFPGVNLTSSSATAATTPGAPRPRRRTTSTRSPRSCAGTTSTTSTRASAWRWRSSTAPTRGRRTPPTRRRAGSETLTAYRTVHGIVYARGTVGGKKVAFASARTTYFHEADSALGFFEPQRTRHA